MFKNKFINDERIKKVRQKIESEAFKIMIFLLLASMLVKTRLLGYPTKDVYIEFGILMFVSLYVIIKIIIEGAYTVKQKSGDTRKKKYIRSSVYAFIGSVCGSILIGLITYLLSGTAFVTTIKNIWILYTVLPIVMSLLYIAFDVVSSKFADKKISKNEDS